VNQTHSDRNQATIAIELLKEAASKDHKLKLEVTSQSMTPMLRKGDHIIVEQVLPDQLRRGNLVVIRRPSDLVTHRVIDIDPAGWIFTKGDNHPYRDPPVPLVDILGRVTAIEQDQHIFDLSTPAWIFLNRILGFIAKWETTTLQIGRKLKSDLVTDALDRGVSTGVDRSREGLKRPIKTMLIRLIRLPFQILANFLIAFSKRKRCDIRNN
jgi:signal peptidase I